MSEGVVMELTEANFDDTIADGVTVVDLWAPWCAPCHMQTPILEKVAKIVGTKAKIARLNVDEAMSVAGRFGVQAIPTLLLLKDGKEVNRFVGVQSEATLLGAIDEVRATEG